MSNSTVGVGGIDKYSITVFLDKKHCDITAYLRTTGVAELQALQ